MKVAGEYTFAAPQAMVWQALLDPEVLGSVMPGGEGFAQVGENEYAGTLKIKVGPVQGVFQGNIKLSDIVPPQSYRMEVDGKGAPGFVKASGNLQLEGQGEQTLMHYQGDARIGGRIASVGQRLLDSSAKSIIRQSLEGLNEYLKAQVAAQAVTQATAAGEPGEAAPAPVPQYTPPGQTTIALNVARDVLGDLIPPERRPLAVGAGVVILLVVVYLIVR